MNFLNRQVANEVEVFFPIQKIPFYMIINWTKTLDSRGPHELMTMQKKFAFEQLM